MTPEYAAGLFDGEGSIGFYPVKEKQHHKAWFRRSVVITGCWLPMIEELQRTYGGLVYPHNKSKKQGWSWKINRKDEMVLFLESIQPHCIEKATQVNVALMDLRGEI